MPGNIAVLEAAGINLAEAYELCGYGPGSVTGGNTIITPKRVCTKSNLGTEAFAIFGQYEIGLGMLNESLSAFRLKLGGRWSSEHVESENPSIVILAGGAGPGVLHPTAASTHVERTFRDFTPEAGLEWQPTKDVLVYYTYSEGFKAGSGENASGSTTIVNPEKMFNHEAGIKTSFSRMLTLNLAAYAYTLDGLQLNKTIAGGPTGYTTIFQNAAKTRAKGIEADVLLRPARGLRLSGALSYTDAHFVDYLTLDPLNPANIDTPPVPAYNPVTNPDPTAFGAPGGGDIQLAGNDTRNSPRWSWNIHGEYDVRSPIGLFTPSFDVSHKSRTFFSEYERDIESSKAFTLVDLSLAFETNDGRIRAQLWTKNLFNVFRPSSTFALATGRLLGATWLPPRTYGVSVGYKF
jgi:iron complex outermembrane receptor protein